MKFAIFNLLLLANGLLIGVDAQNPIVQNILNDVRIDSMTYFVQQLSGEEAVIFGGTSDTIFSRHKDQPGNEMAFQFAKHKFLKYGLAIDSLSFSQTGKNLLGIKVGNLFPNKKYILGAHYDNVGSFIAPGADDNASGSSAVLEGARVFSTYSFPFTIVFALWDEEEQGLVGSQAFASSTSDTILGYINMDMLGWDGNNDSTADLHVKPIANSLQFANKAIEADSLYSIGLNLHIVNPGSNNTDHASFWNNGYTAIGINEEYGNDFNPFWHSLADSLGQFNLPFYEKCAKLAYATLGTCALDSAITISVSEGHFSDPGFTLYPNPASEKLTILGHSQRFNATRIDVLNMSGQLQKSVLMGSQGVEIDVSDFQPGLYYLNVFHKQQRIGGQKWIKRK